MHTPLFWLNDLHRFKPCVCQAIWSVGCIYLWGCHDNALWTYELQPTFDLMYAIFMYQEFELQQFQWGSKTLKYSEHHQQHQFERNRPFEQHSYRSLPWFQRLDQLNSDVSASHPLRPAIVLVCIVAGEYTLESPVWTWRWVQNVNFYNIKLTTMSQT